MDNNCRPLTQALTTYYYPEMKCGGWIFYGTCHDAIDEKFMEGVLLLAEEESIGDPDHRDFKGSPWDTQFPWCRDHFLVCN